jgi:hypothetical protein
MVKKIKKKKDIFNDGINLPFHVSNYILTVSNMIGEGLTNIVMIIPGLYASLSLIILSPLYAHTNVGRKKAFSIGIEGLKSIPSRALMGVVSILISPIAYPLMLFRKKENVKVKKERVPFKGTPNIV